MTKKLLKFAFAILITLSIFSTQLTVVYGADTTPPPNPCDLQSSDSPCVVAPKIPKPNYLPGPDARNDAENVHEKYFIRKLLPGLVRGGINILGGISIIMIMFAGIQYIIAFGDEGAVDTAKRNLQYSILGFIVALFSYTIVSLISGIPLSSNNSQTQLEQDQIINQNAQ